METSATTLDSAGCFFLGGRPLRGREAFASGGTIARGACCRICAPSWSMGLTYPLTITITMVALKLINYRTSLLVVNHT